jgi:hypothetical protein
MPALGKDVGANLNDGCAGSRYTKHQTGVVHGGGPAAQGCNVVCDYGKCVKPRVQHQHTQKLTLEQQAFARELGAVDIGHDEEDYFART